MPNSQSTQEKRRQLQDLLARIRSADSFESVTISRQIKDLSADISADEQVDDSETDE